MISTVVSFVVLLFLIGSPSVPVGAGLFLRLADPAVLLFLPLFVIRRSRGPRSLDAVETALLMVLVGEIASSVYGAVLLSNPIELREITEPIRVVIYWEYYCIGSILWQRKNPLIWTFTAFVAVTTAVELASHIPLLNNVIARLYSNDVQILKYGISAEHDDFRRSIGIYNSANIYGLTVAFAWAFWFPVLRYHARPRYIAYCLILGLAVLASVSRGALLAILLVVVMTELLKQKRPSALQLWKGFGYSIFFSALIVGATSLSTPVRARVAGAFSSGDAQLALGGRAFAWYLGTQKALRSPVFGWGIEKGYGDAGDRSASFRESFTAETVAEYYLSFEGDNLRLFTKPHNEFIDFWSSYGLLGLAGLVKLLFEFLRCGRVFRSAQLPALYAVCVSSFLVLVLNEMVEGFYYSYPAATFIILCLGWLTAYANQLSHAGRPEQLRPVLAGVSQQ